MPLLVGCLTPLLAVLESLDLCRSDEMVGLFDVAMQGEGKADSMSKQLLAKMLPEIAQLLPADSLLGRTVVGHNDMHGTALRQATRVHSGTLCWSYLVSNDADARPVGQVGTSCVAKRVQSRATLCWWTLAASACCRRQTISVAILRTATSTRREANMTGHLSTTAKVRPADTT